MPANPTTQKTLEQVVDEYGRYPFEAFEFVRLGLSNTVERIHGDIRGQAEMARHITGVQLSWGLRIYAVQRYGVLAKTVLRHWGICHTGDFGRIVFAMIDSKLMQKTDDDDLRDFDRVYDFDTAFDPPPRCETQPRIIFPL